MGLGPPRLARSLLLVALTVASCGGAAVVDTPSPSPSATASPTVASAQSWNVSNTSKATVRVREQLVGVSLPSDAVLTASGAAGSFQINGDGTFSGDSKISFDLTTLSSDQRARDDFVKRDTLATQQFSKAEFVPTKASGLTLPLPASGTFTFTVTGNMTIRGKTKEVTFDVQATREGANLTATATANPTWKFEDFGLPIPSVPFRVVSINDEIKLVVQLVATGPAA